MIAARDHLRCDRRGQQKRCLDVDGERLVKCRLGKFVVCPDSKDAGVVGEDVHLGGALGECAHIVG
jgi:hypothetical protein